METEICIANEIHEITERFSMNLNSMSSGTSYQHFRPGHEGGYRCPIKCEGSKTYDQPGNCPVCKMKLVLAGSD